MKNKSNPTFVLELLGNKLNMKRDMQLDAIKVASRSDDQANSACNIVKKLYYYFEWLVQKEISAYNSSNDGHSEKIDFSDRKERDRMSEIIFNAVFDNKKLTIDENEHDFLEPWSRYLSLNTWVNNIMYHVGVYSGLCKDEFNIQDSIEAIDSMSREIDWLVSGHNPYYKCHKS